MTVQKNYDSFFKKESAMQATCDQIFFLITVMVVNLEASGIGWIYTTSFEWNSTRSLKDQ